MTSSLALLVAISALHYGCDALKAGTKVLIVQNKGGGHGEIGYHLAKSLSDNGAKVSILQAKTKMDTQPFCDYSALEGMGVQITQADLATETDSFFAANGDFDTIIDNNSKAVEDVSKYLEKSKELIYVSSGGMYKGACPEGGHVETDDVKADNACRVVEEFLVSQSKPFASFRPQYIYGANTNKRSNLDWFFDRIATAQPSAIPLPGDGEQLIALTNAADVASCLTACVGRCDSNFYNLGTDKFVSYKDLCRKVASALGKDPALLSFASYDPKALDFKPSFPFRPATFTVNPAKTAAKFSWAPAASLDDDLKMWADQYTALSNNEETQGASKEEDVKIMMVSS